MRHQVDHRKLGRTTEHRIAMLRNQAVSLVQHDRIKTTLPKAKELRRFVERLITLAKKDTLHARRIAARHVHDPAALKKLFAVLGPLYAQRPGGYTRIMKLGFRRGDGAQEAIIELVGREPKTEEKPTKGSKKTKPAAKQAKKAEAVEAAEEKPTPKKKRAAKKTEPAEPTEAEPVKAAAPETEAPEEPPTSDESAGGAEGEAETKE
jgi:large subunit ribosomal protein L17